MQLNEELFELIAQRFKAMSEPTRLRIIHLLKDRELSVSEIAEHAGLKHGTASANLNALHKAGLVTFRREGTKVLYQVSNSMVFQVCDIVCQSLKEDFLEYEKLRRAIG
ncbi:MAG: metalloregulator ArsR/SmtB family transcription factor [bacterium]|nr:metalloregulator ArsR/SmtB family transcription factor [bacterium]